MATLWLGGFGFGRCCSFWLGQLRSLPPLGRTYDTMLRASVGLPCGTATIAFERLKKGRQQHFLNPSNKHPSYLRAHIMTSFVNKLQSFVIFSYSTSYCHIRSYPDHEPDVTSYMHPCIRTVLYQSNLIRNVSESCLSYALRMSQSKAETFFLLMTWRTLFSIKIDHEFE